MDEIQDRIDKQADATEPSCSIALFSSDMMRESEIRIPLKVLSEIKNLGETHDLYYTSLFDLFGHAFYESITCKDLHAELVFIKDKTNDKLLQGHLDNLLQLAAACRERNDCKLLLNGN